MNRALIALSLPLAAFPSVAWGQAGQPVIPLVAGLAVSATNPLPTTATITPSGTQNVNLTQILGAAPSATNPIWVSPATASTPWTVNGSGTAGTAATGVVTIQGIAAMTKLLVTPDSVALPANQSVNITQWGSTTLGTPTNFGTTPGAVVAASVNASHFLGTVAATTGNGVVGTGVQRVAIASDNTAFSVNATLSAETTKVIGTVNIAAAQTIAVTNAGTFAAQATLPTTPLIASGNGIVITPTTEAASGVAPSTAVSTAESCRVLQASAANVYKVTVAIAATTGYVMIFNATSAPGDGAVSPAWPAIRVVSDGTSGWADIPFDPPLRLGTGATVCFSSTGPFTKTASATAAIGGLVK